MSKVWFITGTSRGFGRAFAEAALSRGDRVAATARRPGALKDLVDGFGEAVLPLELDVTDGAQVEAAVDAALDRFGRLDVVVNNAGYGLFGAVEELSEQAVRDQMETNFFGALKVSRAVLPAMRRQGAGHIIQISSVGGIGAFPTLGGYHASKWALEGLSESLAAEVAPAGITVTLVEPGAFATDWGGSSAVHAEPLEAYDGLRSAMGSRPRQPGADPQAAARALLEVVDADAPPLRVLFGAGPVEMVKGIYQQRLDTWAQWADVARAAQG
ncbi:SDR family NAD(P)-dependent oxidoreductase [Streptomyces sp. NPDC051985]|uniref:SDR family NAD(P)-dependent oxidoreductase n=1 Tax=Streptomyces sp. NPDC051985 TaxID=3155807 RepID=UPI0034267D98